jgi:hypothetical protein
MPQGKEQCFAEMQSIVFLLAVFGIIIPSLEATE